jgi:hypothetical protein
MISTWQSIREVSTNRVLLAFDVGISQKPFTQFVLNAAGGKLVQLPVRDEIIVECLSWCDWWDAQLTAKKTERTNRASNKRARLAAAAKFGVALGYPCDSCLVGRTRSLAL